MQRPYFSTPAKINNTFEINESSEGECIEMRVERIMNNNEPITDGAPTIYTERKDGVLAQYNIRTDRFELALDATDHITKEALTKRQERIKEREEANKPTDTSGTENKPAA